MQASLAFDFDCGQEAGGWKILSPLIIWVPAVQQVGFIGLGNMGARMAANLMHAGFPIVIHDHSPKTMHDLRETGAETASSPAELASLPGDL